MKHTRMFAAAMLLLCMAAFPMPAAASAFYVGSDFVVANVDYKTPNPLGHNTMYGTQAYVGVHLLKNVDVEAGYLGLWGNDTVTTILLTKQAVSTDIQGGNADVVLHVPLLTRLDLLGVAGVSYTNAQTTAGLFHHGVYAWGYRIGAGLQVGLNDDIAVRVRGYYSKPNDNGGDGAWSETLGLVYNL